MTVPRVLIVAGSDSGGGAGIQADLKTVSVLGAFGMTAVTALTAQDTTRVHGTVETAAEFVGLQIEVCARDLGCDAVKTGMLASERIVEVVADRIRALRLAHVVVDPVMIAKSGTPLLTPDAVESLKRRLLPLATVVTPNLHEAEALGGRKVETLAAMREAARAIHGLGARNVVVKGGHLEGIAADIFFDGRHFEEYREERIETRNTHGTGCVFASAIAASLAWGESLPASIGAAKRFVTAAIRGSLSLGKGHGPANPHAWLSVRPS